MFMYIPEHSAFEEGNLPSGCVHDPLQVEQVDAGVEGDDLRILFEDPEFPPGFEPNLGLSKSTGGPEEDYHDKSPTKMDQAKTRMFRVKKAKKPNKKFANISAEARECFKYGQRLRIHCPYPRRSLANLDRILRGSGVKK